MKINTLQERLRVNNSSGKKAIAKILAEEGFKENCNMHGDILSLAEKHKSSNPLDISFIQSLFWAHYAKPSSEFVKLVLNYFEQSDEVLFERLGDYTLQYKKEYLVKTIKSWKAILIRFSSNIPKKVTVNNTLSLQGELTSVAIGLSNLGLLSHFGAWFCNAPFLALVLWKKELWDDKKLDELILPLGKQVIRGIDWLSRNSEIKYNVEGIDTLNLSDGLDAAIKAMGFQKELADLAQSRILPINTGLWLLGKKEDET